MIKNNIIVVAKRELLFNLKTVRMLVMTVLFALAVIGGAYGFSMLSFHPTLIPESIKEVLTQRNPNTILYLSGMFVAFVGTISAIVISFDSIVREKLRNTIELLLCRPITKAQIIIGKFLGAFASLAIPVAAVILCALLAIWSALGALPSFKMALGFFILTFLLLAIFIAIQFVFSSLARSFGTAIIFGIAVWFLFTSFWTLVPLSTAYISNVPLESAEYNILRCKIDLFSPIGSYDLALGILANSSEGIFTPLPPILPFISLILWLLLPLWCSSEIFKRTEY